MNILIFVIKNKEVKVGITYKEAGVNIQAADNALERIKSLAKSTFNKNVLHGIGLFGAFYKIDLNKWKNPVIVSSVDGVGTKIKIAIMLNKHDTIGQDLVNHCVNDIAVCGAEPQFFLDYIAFGKLIPEKVEQIIKGFSIACKENNVALIGGETAEMPGFYAEDEYDVAGTIIGLVEQEKIINGNNVEKGDLLIGFASNGLHTNGYSLARKVLLNKFKLDEKIDEIDNLLGDELLRIHKSYLNIIKLLKDNIPVKAFSHITGGGIIDNTKRVIPEGLNMKIDWNAWERPAIFHLIQQSGNVPEDEMRDVFNLGIGLIAIANKNDVDRIINLSKSIGETCFVIGEIY